MVLMEFKNSIQGVAIRTIRGIEIKLIDVFQNS